MYRGGLPEPVVAEHAISDLTIEYRRKIVYTVI